MASETDTTHPIGSTDYVIEQMERGFHLIPDHMHGAIKRYILNGMQPGGFLTALLSNDLMGAMRKGDDDNLRALADWGRFLYNYVPSGSYGSVTNFNAWLMNGGYLGGESAA